ncbi:MAG: rhodanese-like domain-containing protein [Magnetococcales bacterium]|nr:rhodanese-like domain-containing protein [Magnetococcales bacterium]
MDTRIRKAPLVNTLHQSPCHTPLATEEQHAVQPSAPHSPVDPQLGQLTPREAFELVSTTDAAFIDIRSEVEHFFVGSPTGVVNIPWQDAPDFEENPRFVQEVLQAVKRRERMVVLICRSGHRSIDAGNRLIHEGFQSVYHVLEGFEGDRDERHHRSSLNGWRFHGLPWVQC